MTRREEEHFVFGCLFLVTNRLQAEGDKLSGDLTLKQWFLLLVLFKMKDEEPSVNAIAARLGSTRQNTKKMLALLEEKGFVTMQKSTEDARALCIYPTPKAVSFFQQNKGLGSHWLETLFACVEDEELACLSRVLQRWNRCLKEAAEGAQA